MSAATNFIATINGKLIDLGNIASQQTSHTVQISANDSPMQRYSITFKQKVAIKTSDITVSMNGTMTGGAQRIIFGPRRSDVYVATSQVTTSGTGNTLSFSTDGITWYGLGATILDINGQGICYNGKIWVAVANTTSGTNTLAYSYDGRLWTGLGKTIFTNANSVIWNGTMFVAGGQGPSVGTGNTLAYSYDGINWIGLGATACAYTVLNLGWNGRIWLACGQSTITTGRTAFSLNGKTWTNSTTSSTIFTGNCVSVAWNGQTWLGVGGGGNTIGYSVDGNVWAAVTSSASYITSNGYAISWNGKIWVAGGINATNNLAYTTDPLGRNGWTTLGRPIFSSGIKHIKWTGKTFIALGYGGNTYAYSVDGINWTGGSGVIDLSKGGSCIEYNNKGIHSINFPQFMIHTGNSYSNNGRTWITAIKPTTNEFNSPPIYNGKLWIATSFGNGTLPYQFFSYDGVNWLTTNLNSIGRGISYAVWTGKIWVAITRESICNLLYSYDGISWKNTEDNFGGNLRSYIQWNGKIFIATCGTGVTGNVGYSYDGITWRDSSLPDVIVCCWNGTLWTTGQYYSYDGITWLAAKTPVTTVATSIDWNGMIFALTNGSGICISYDGINWVTASNPGATTGGITWVGDSWYIYIDTGTYIIYTSYNCINWTAVSGSLTISNTNRRLGTTYNIPPIPYIQHPTIAVGAGQNTIAYSDDGITWEGLGSTIFSIEGCGVFWNGQMWVAAGNGGNSLAYSMDGLTWIGLGTSVFTSGSAVAHNGNIWVATGSGGNTIAYSKNGINWTGLETRVFSNQGYGICYNGTAWVAGGSFTGATGNTLAYSVDGITWTGIGRAIFTTACYDVAMNGNIWFAVGQGGNTIAHTLDLNGSTGWVGLGTTIFSIAGLGICWNGQYFVAAGSGGNSLAYNNSLTSASSFVGVTNSTNLLSAGTGICWNGVRFIATGAVGSGNTLAYSQDGITWYPGYSGYSSRLTSSIFTVNANCIASNPGVGFPTFDSQLVLDPYGFSGTSTLDFYTEAYQQQGFSQISISINVNNIV